MAQLGARLDGIEEVVGSNPIGSTKSDRSNPETWVTERTGYMGNSLGPEGLYGNNAIGKRFYSRITPSICAAWRKFASRVPRAN